MVLLAVCAVVSGDSAGGVGLWCTWHLYLCRSPRTSGAVQYELGDSCVGEFVVMVGGRVGGWFPQSAGCAVRQQ